MINNILSLGLLVVLFLTPLLPAAFGFGFEQVKVLFLISGVGILGIFWGISAAGRLLKVSLVKKLVGIFILSLSFSTVLGLDPQTSFYGDYPYFQGLILYIFLGIFFMIVSTVSVRIQEVSFVILISSLVVSLLAVRDFILTTFFQQAILNYGGRVVSSFGQPNLYAGFLVMGLPFGYFLSLEVKDLAKKMTIWGLMGLSFVAILISQSRDAIFILILLTFCLFFKKIYHKRVQIIRSKISITLLVVSAFLILVVGTNVLFKIVDQEIVRPRSSQWLLEESPEKRIYIWGVSKEVFLKRPIFGNGLENFDLAFGNYFQNLNFDRLNDPAAHSLKNLSVNRAHSYPVDLLVMGGIIVFASWFLLVFWLVKKSPNLLFRVFLMIFLLWSSVQIPSSVHLMMFWLVVGLIEKNTSQMN